MADFVGDEGGDLLELRRRRVRRLDDQTSFATSYLKDVIVFIYFILFSQPGYWIYYIYCTYCSYYCIGYSCFCIYCIYWHKMSHRARGSNKCGKHVFAIVITFLIAFIVFVIASITVVIWNKLLHCYCTAFIADVIVSTSVVIAYSTVFKLLFKIRYCIFIAFISFIASIVCFTVLKTLINFVNSKTLF